MNLKMRQKSRKEHPFIYLAPTLIVLAGLVGLPLFNNVIKSFSENGVFPVLNQYNKLFHDKVFLKDMKNTFLWLLYTVPLEMIFGLFIAVLLNSQINCRKFWRTVFIVPWVIPSIVVCIVWKWIYDADYGILNHILFQMGLIDKYQLWVSSPKQALACVAAVYVWKITPFVLIMYLSGLQSISADIYEASRLDGANWIQQVGFITIPLLFPVMRSIILVSIIWSLNSFVYVYSVSGGGPARSSEIAQIFIYKTGIEQFNFEYSAAAANVFFMIVMVIAFLYIVITEKKESSLT